MTVKSEFDLITLLAAQFGIVGAYFLVRSILNNTKDEIAALASTHWGFSLPLVKTLAMQKGESIIGFGLVTVSGFFWLASSFLVCLLKLTLFSTSLSLMALLIVWFLSKNVSSRIYKKLYHDVKIELFSRNFEAEFNASSGYKFVEKNFLDDIATLDLHLDPSMDAPNNLIKLLKHSKNFLLAKKVILFFEADNEENINAK